MRLSLRANAARDNANVTRRSHCQKSLLRDNDREVFHAILEIIYVDWIALLRRLLIRDNDSRCYLRKMKIISLDWIALLILRRLLITL